MAADESRSERSAELNAIDIHHLRTWQGRHETVSDTVTPQLVAGFRAVLDQEPGRPGAGEPVPPGLNWCLAPPTVRMSEIGPDGHPARGGFLPPVPLPRRMWAGGRLRFEDDLRVGDLVSRRSTVRSVDLKQGRTGALVFVLVEHTLSTERGPAIVEEHDIVYRDLEPPSATKPGSATAAASASDPSTSKPGADTMSRRIEASPVLLFRYSALTFNGHRIHYDRPYVTEVEGYPGLIVHGPLQATLLMGLATEMLGAPLGAFAFRAERPLFDLEPFTIAGERDGAGGRLRVEDAKGRTTMSATAEPRS